MNTTEYFFDKISKRYSNLYNLMISYMKEIFKEIKDKK